MKLRIALPFAAALALWSTLASAAEFASIDARNANWRDQVLSFLKLHSPRPENVSGGFSGDFDLYVYAVKGSYKGTYSLQHVQHGHGTANGVITALMDGKVGKILGVSGNDFHILTWTPEQ